MTRLTVSSWNELCRFINANKGKTIKLMPIEWTGSRGVDRKTKAYTDVVQENEVMSIIFEVERL